MTPASHEELERAFAMLLGEPVAAFPPGTYELWFWVDRDLLDADARAVARTAAELAQPIADAPSASFDTDGEWWNRYRVDYARSLYVFDPDDVEDAQTWMQADRWDYTGSDLIALAADSGVEVTDLLGACWYIARRAVTDGSLFDAMAAATCSSSTPSRLLARTDTDPTMRPSIVIEPSWESKLAAIDDPTLREHFEMSCVDAETGRWFGSYLPPVPRVANQLKPVAARGRELVACWFVGENQAARAVFRVT
jgi:hypothetical protein